MDESPASAARALAEQSALVLDCLPRAIVVVDRDATIVGWNQVAEHFYGWTAAAAIGTSFVDLLAPTDLRDEAESILRSVLEGDAWSGSVRVNRRDLLASTTYSFAAPLRAADGSIVGAVNAADDSSALHSLEQRATDLTEHLLLALSAGRLGTWRWNMETGMTTWDAAMEQLFGVEPGEFDGTYDAWLKLLPPEDLVSSVERLREAIETREPYTIEHRVLLRDGTTRWLEGRGKVILDAEGNVTGTIGCSTDVTSRKLAEDEAIRRAQEAESAAAAERLQRERLEFLAGLNDIALNAPDHRVLMAQTTSAAVPRLGDWCALHYSPRRGAPPEVQVAHSDPAAVDWALAMRARHPLHPDAPTGVAAVLRTGRSEFVRDIDDLLVEQAIAHRRGAAAELRSIADALQLTSVITVPLISKRGVVGAMQFVSAESRRRYDDNDVALAEAVAGRVAEALDSAWLSEQQRSIATTLQAALLPARLPSIEGVSLATRYWAAGEVSEVGGDFYDVFAIGPRKWALVIGDVCGKGPEAAAITATARHTIRAAATHGAGPTAVLNWVNDAILAGATGLFCTVLYSTLEQLDDGGWRYTSVAGGHPLPVLVDEGGTVRLGAYGTLIGALPAISVKPSAVDLLPGATIVLFTDGVTDLHPPHGLEDHELEALVRDATAVVGDADAVAERIGAAIERQMPIPERDDDVAIVVLRLES